LDYNNGNGVSYVVLAEVLQARSVEFRGRKLSAVKLSELTRSSWLVSERVQLSVESQSVKRRL
jgi:hypothetical protein